jgi:hypothetical protein
MYNCIFMKYLTTFSEYFEILLNKDTLYTIQVYIILY